MASTPANEHGTVYVSNVKELMRAFRLADKEEAKGLRKTLLATAEPVKRAAEGKAMSRITKMPRSPGWSVMRLGYARGVVYMVPKQKGRGSRANRALRRPNLKDLLLDRAMIPAVVEHESEVVADVDRMLGTVGKRWETA